MWWPRRADPPLSDAEFNGRLDSLVGLTAKIFAEPTDGYEPVLCEVRAKELTFTALVSKDGGAVDDWPDFLRQLGRDLRRRNRRPPQAMFFLDLALDKADQDLIRIDGATSDGRLNAAAVHLTRDVGDLLHYGDTTVLHHPLQDNAVARRNFARHVLSAWAD